MPSRFLNSLALLFLISMVLLSFSRSALRAEGFIESFGGPIEVFVFVQNNRISEHEFRKGLSAADIDNYIVHRKRPDSIYDSNALVLLLDQWKNVYSAPLQKEFAALYKQVAALKETSAIATYVLKLGNDEEFLVVVYNLHRLKKRDANCLASDFVASLTRAIGNSIAEKVDCFKQGK